MHPKRSRKLRLGPKQMARLGDKMVALIRSGQQSKINAHELAAEVMDTSVDNINGDALYDGIRKFLKMFRCIYCRCWLSLTHEYRPEEEACENCHRIQERQRYYRDKNKQVNAS